MPYTAVQIANQGFAKLGSARIGQIQPPRTPLERHVSVIYKPQKEAELAKHRWVFARVYGYPLTLTETLTGVDRPYKFVMPSDALRMIRTRDVEWQQYGRHVYSAYETLTIAYVKDVPEGEFDPLFVDVLACRLALESAEYVTQSNSKKADAEVFYKEAVANAKSANAIAVGPEDYGVSDETFSWITARTR
jgi:hypothetical protein